MAQPLPSLTNVLNTFSSTFDVGRTALGVNVQSLFGILVTIEVILAGVYLALGADGNLSLLAKKILQIGIIDYIIKNYAVILHNILDGFIFTGQKAAAGPGYDLAAYRDPDKIFKIGMDLVTPALLKVIETSQASYFRVPSADSIIILLCSLIGLFAISIMAIQVFITYLEYLLISTMGFILIPFAIFKPLAFLSQQLMGAIIGFGIKLMTLSVIIAVSVSILGNAKLAEEVSWQQSFDFLLIAASLCVLSIHAPSLCRSLLTGTPSLGASAVSTGVSPIVSAAALGARATGAAGALAVAAAAKLRGSTKTAA